MDIGEQAVQEIYKGLLIDEAWSWRRPRGFSWIAHRLAQSLDASPLFENRGVMISRVASRVLVVEDVGLPQTDAEKLLSQLNRLAVGSAYIYIPERRSVESVLGHNIHEETMKYRSQEIATYQMVQLALAELDCERLAQAFHGKVACQQHSVSGERIEPDDMLNILRQMYLPAGATPSTFADGSEFEQVYQHVVNTPFFSAGGDSGGITIEVEFGNDDTTLIRLKTDEPHPHLGNGLGVFLNFRLNGDESLMAGLANQLNQLQFAPKEVVPAFGAWCLSTFSDHATLGHAFFAPNLHFRPGVALDCAMAAIQQALWVDQLLFPNLPQRSAVSVVSKRLGLDKEG